jgi:heat shock protein HslJ
MCASVVGLARGCDTRVRLASSVAEPGLKENSTMRLVYVTRLRSPAFAMLAAAAVASCGGKAPPATPSAPAVPPPAPTLEQLQSASVSGVFAQPVRLANGVYEGETLEPGAASRPRLALLESSVHFGDVDGAEGSEAVAMLGSSGGGSGEFAHVAVFGVRDGAVATLGTAPVGDRTQLQSLWLERDAIVMDVIEAGPDDAACCPTQVSRKKFALQDGALKQVSSEVLGVLGVSMLAANEWQLARIDGEPLPGDVEPPLVLFERGTLRGFAGCNRFTATVKESKPGEIDIAPAAATQMACPQPRMELEQRFLQRLDAVNRYSYAGGDLVLDWRDASGSGALVFRK